eukprot:TRINITY_DN13812_c0_g3_i1.p1 TRINITY_DN13812_c0_g3~~TRINITY_DN13812_c0_g3_i1.p1  ORF type:complete len:209 (+),score=27.96 TRINITY_DN13812_c0_g3_i1:140-766(+)
MLLLLRLLLLLLALPRGVLTSGSGAAAGVSSSRWRVVGRGASSRWVVERVGFYSDAQCTSSAEILARPLRGHKNGERYNGAAFAAPNVVRQQLGSAADVFVDGAPSWDSGAACAAAGDACHVGFRWLGEQVPAGRRVDGFASLGLLGYSEVAPRCVRVWQATSPGSFASTLAVQYWHEGSGGWQTHTEAASPAGGATSIRLPPVPIAR